MSAGEWGVAGLCAVALVSVVGWVKAWRDAKEWETVCVCLGDQYDRLMVELNQPKPVVAPAQPQRSPWLN